jgi:ATP-dependent Zn protease
MKGITYIIAAWLAFAVTAFASSQPKSMTYRDFLDHLRNGTVSNVAFQANGMLVTFAGEDWANDYVVLGKHRRFQADPLLREELNKAGIEPTVNRGENPSLWVVLAAMLPSLLWSVIPLATLAFMILIYRKLKRLTKQLDNGEQ